MDEKILCTQCNFPAFILSDQPQPTLTLTVGVTYTFVVKNSDQQLFPFAFGTATNVPYLTSSAITVTEGMLLKKITTNALKGQSDDHICILNNL